MYSYSTRTVPQVTYARKPVQPQSLAQKYNYVKPIDRVVKGKRDDRADYVPG
jgi:hypothetical protein